MLAALILFGISTVAAAPLMDMMTDDDENEDTDQVPDEAAGGDLLAEDDASTIAGMDADEVSMVFDLPSGAGSETLVSEDRAGGEVTLVADPPSAGMATLVSEDPGAGSVTVVSEDPFASVEPLVSEDLDAGSVTLVSEDAMEDEVASAPEDDVRAPDAEADLDFEWRELATFDVGSEAADLPHADISGFEKGEHVLDVTIFAGDHVEDVEVELVPSEDGADSVLTANGQVLAILRAVPDADFDDFRISVQDAA